MTSTPAMNPQSVFAIIPARGGSKGIPRKNVRILAGKPLVVHSIEHSLAARSVTRTFVSTDDPEIAEISESAGAEVVMRPIELSGDQATSESAIEHVLQTFANEEMPDLVVFLQCTSPFRGASDIDAAVNTIVTREVDSVLSVSPSHRFLWEKSRDGVVRAINYDFHQRPRRQEMTSQYVENGSIYVFRPQGLLETRNRLSGRIALHIMDEDAAIDIDSMTDFRLAEILMAERKKVSN